MKNSTVETLIGATVVAIAAAFFLFAYTVSGKGNGEGYRVSAEFDNAEGINVSTDVRMAGVKIGTVVAQELNYENFQAVITMTIDPQLKLTEDTTAKVTAEGLLGSRFIALEPGGSETLLAEGGVITSTQGAVDIWSLISQTMFEKTGTKEGGGGTPPDSQPQ